MKGSTILTHGFSEAPKSEIIKNLKKDIKSKEDKLEHLLDEKQKTNNENRIVELTNMIRITEQEIKFGKEDLENEKIDDTKYKSMWSSLKHSLKNGKWLDEDTIEGVLLAIDNIEYEAKHN